MKAVKLTKKLHETYLSVFGEDMATMSMIGQGADGKNASVDDLGKAPEPAMGMVKAGVPGGFQSYAKVVKVKKNGGAKEWLGINTDFSYDPETGETDLLNPDGAMMSLQDIMQVAKIEQVLGQPGVDADSKTDPKTPEVMQKY